MNRVVIICFLSLIAIFIFHISNGENKINEQVVSGLCDTQQDESKNFIENLNGFWQCYKYSQNLREPNENYGEEYAQEFSKYAFFELSGDTLKGVGIYNTPVYSYSYPVAFKEYGDESLFITYLRPKDADSLTFIVPYNDYTYYWENIPGTPAYTDAPLNKMYCYYRQNLIASDRGYFFFFKRMNAINHCGISGVPGDDRNSFSVDKVYSHMNFADAYLQFKREFPYAGKDLTALFSLKTFFDKTNGIAYEWTNNCWTISKEDPLGHIVISFEQRGMDIALQYRMQYPFSD